MNQYKSLNWLKKLNTLIALWSNHPEWMFTYWLYAQWAWLKAHLHHSLIVPSHFQYMYAITANKSRECGFIAGDTMSNQWHWWSYCGFAKYNTIISNSEKGRFFFLFHFIWIAWLLWFYQSNDVQVKWYLIMIALSLDILTSINCFTKCAQF